VINRVTANQASIELATSLLRQGKLVAIPTETVYGLGADAKNPYAVKKIFAAKGRPADHPLIVHIADVSQLTAWAVDIPDSAYKLAEGYWPGPITLILKKHPDVPMEVTGGQETVALRIPNHPLALAVLQAFGGGIAAPSANRYCRISPTEASHVAEELGDKVDLILDGGTCQVGLESTIIDLSGDMPRLLRPGQISKVDIQNALNQLVLLPEVNEKIHVPGAVAVHYAPNIPAYLCSVEQIRHIQQGFVFKNRHKLGVLAYSLEILPDEYTELITMPTQAEPFAHELYGKLRALDKRGIDIILIEQPPCIESWRAVNNRLSKAAKKFELPMGKDLTIKDSNHFESFIDGA
jgi:L-threonylcarbamoyladenylate synthase